MSSEQLEQQVKKAAELIESADQRTGEFEARQGQMKYDAVILEADAITDLLEEAQQILFETEAEGLPDQEAVPEAAPEEDADQEVLPEEAELTEEEALPFDFTLSKQELEHRSRQLEARVYRKAADLVGDPIVQPGQATDQQDELLNTAAVALEAGLGSKPDPETLLSLLELRVLQLEIKKARYLADLLVKIGEDGPFAEKGQEWLDRFDSDEKLKDRGRCFIATAACGANDTPDVLTLRRFRDQTLAQSGTGRRLISLYYKISPPLARTIEHHPTLARTVRTCFVRPTASIVRKAMS